MRHHARRGEARCRPFQSAASRKGLRCDLRCFAMKGCQLLGVGSSAPEKVLTNDDLATFIETNDEWIAARTGIRQRHVLSPGESITEHSTTSARKALEMAGVAGSDVDMVILATSSPDDLFGSATQIQHAIGATNAIAFDLTAACSGFVLGLVTASQFIRTGAKKNVLVVGADALSRYLDWNDRGHGVESKNISFRAPAGSCILFGDGAGAVLISAHEGPCALLGYDMNSDGKGYCELNAPFDAELSGKALNEARRSDTAAYKNLFMNGSEVFKFAVRAVPKTLKVSLKDAGMSENELDWLIMHQANQRILDAAAKKLSLAPEQVVSNLAEYGNTSAASIPLALDDAVSGGKVKSGDTIAFAGFGAGLTWASAIMRWQ